MKKGQEVPVLAVTAHDGPVMHSQVTLARSLGRLGAPVHLVHPNGRTAASWSRYVTSTTALRLDPAAPGRYLEQLASLARRVGGQPVLVALDDVSALLVAEHEQALRTVCRLNVPPFPVAAALADKRRLHDLCVTHGIATPRRALARTPADVAAFAAEVGFPLVVKATTAGAPLGGEAHQSRSVRIAGNLDEAVAALGPVGHQVLLQSYVPGGADSVWMFNGYFDAASTCRLSFTGTKLRQWHPDTGYTSLGVCRDNPEVESTAIELLESIGYRGIVDLGFRYDARDGSYQLLDVNPRLGATFRLFVGSDGTDVARALYRDLTGQPVSRTRAPEGRRWVTEPQDLAACLSYRRAGRLSLASWLSSYRGVQEVAWFCARDPLPFVALAAPGARLARRPPAPGRTAQVRTATATRKYFDATSSYWRRVYEGQDVSAAIYARRQHQALAWLDEQGAAGGNLLEVGAGAGYATIDLARRSERVVALDSSSAMVAQLAAAVRTAGVEGRVAIAQADVEALPLATASQDAVLALGVLPWLTCPGLALAELHRVLRTGGHLVLSADNLLRLHWRLDPLLSPALRGARRGTRQRLVAHRLADPRDEHTDARLHSFVDLARLAEEAGFEVVTSFSFGFGPFTFLGRPVLTVGAGRRVDTVLQRWTNQDGGRLREGAAQHLLLCRSQASVASRGRPAHSA